MSQILNDTPIKKPKNSKEKKNVKWKKFSWRKFLFVDVCRSERNEFGSENSNKSAPSLFLSEYLGRGELLKRDNLRFSRGFLSCFLEVLLLQGNHESVDGVFCFCFSIEGDLNDTLCMNNLRRIILFCLFKFHTIISSVFILWVFYCDFRLKLDKKKRCCYHGRRCLSLCLCLF